MKFDNGELVRISHKTGTEFRPGELADVCGMVAADVNRAKTFGVSPGDMIYLIELGDGTALEIGSQLLEKADQR